MYAEALMSKTIMILGAGEGQLNFVRICKERGYRVICVSIAGDYPCFKICDTSYHVDTRDKERILEIAQNEQIHAITTDQTDVSVLSVAYVAEHMGLKDIGCDCARRFTNKYSMRCQAKKAGLPVPDFAKAATLVEALEAAHSIGYPVIIKPVDSSGSRGVVKISSDEELRANFAYSLGKSQAQDVIVEKFIRGKEYLADGFAMDHQYVTLDVGDKEYFAVENLFVSKMCMFSSVKNLEDPTSHLVKETNDAIIRAFDLPFGITHAEYLYCEEDHKVYLVECAARGGGVYLSSDLTPLASGFDTNTALIDYLMEDRKIFVDEDRLDNKVSAWLCFAFPEGILTSFDGIDAVMKIPGVHKFCCDGFHVGMKTKALRDDSGKYGPILLSGSNRADCYKIIERVKETFSATIQTEQGLAGLVW